MFKASVQTVTAAVVAGATVFGSTYAAVSADGVTSGEWISVVLNTSKAGGDKY